mmetsp:Transcript_24629/g.79605  ORF Transcript_24629/g.79605 Transcript_24629/m.79605 type:complete len:210 (-) Transcript_24629:27-656(-)
MKRRRDFLDFEAVGGAASAGLFEFASLGADVGLDVAVGVDGGGGRAVSEMFVDFAGFLGAAEEDGAVALGGAEGQFVEGEALAAGLEDPGPGGLREAEGAHGHLRHLQQTRVVRHRAHEDRDLPVLLLHELRQPRQAQGRPVRPRQKQPLQHHLDELRVRTPREEPVQLHQQLQVHVLALRVRPGLVPHAPTARNQVDTHRTKQSAILM